MPLPLREPSLSFSFSKVAGYSLMFENCHSVTLIGESLGRRAELRICAKWHLVMGGLGASARSSEMESPTLAEQRVQLLKRETIFKQVRNIIVNI